MARLGVKINLAIKLTFPISYLLGIYVRIGQKCLISYAFSNEVCVFAKYCYGYVFRWYPTSEHIAIGVKNNTLRYRYNL